MTYREELDAIVRKHSEEKGAAPPAPLNGMQAREFHRCLCLESDPDMTDDKIATDWNLRSPDDPWDLGE